ncbi:hypothetical protein EGW08_016841, partial [Elysia chlorotica]
CAIVFVVLEANIAEAVVLQAGHILHWVYPCILQVASFLPNKPCTNLELLQPLEIHHRDHDGARLHHAEDLAHGRPHQGPEVVAVRVEHAVHRVRVEGDLLRRAVEEEDLLVLDALLQAPAGRGYHVEGRVDAV